MRDGLDLLPGAYQTPPAPVFREASKTSMASSVQPYYDTMCKQMGIRGEKRWTNHVGSFRNDPDASLHESLGLLA